MVSVSLSPSDSFSDELEDDSATLSVPVDDVVDLDLKENFDGFDTPTESPLEEALLSIQSEPEGFEGGFL